jgi:hypothetical protein
MKAIQQTGLSTTFCDIKFLQHDDELSLNIGLSSEKWCHFANKSLYSGLCLALMAHHGYRRHLSSED